MGHSACSCMRCRGKRRIEYACNWIHLQIHGDRSCQDTPTRERERERKTRSRARLVRSQLFKCIPERTLHLLHPRCRCTSEASNRLERALCITNADVSVEKSPPFRGWPEGDTQSVRYMVDANFDEGEMLRGNWTRDPENRVLCVRGNGERCTKCICYVYFRRIMWRVRVRRARVVFLCRYRRLNSSDIPVKVLYIFWVYSTRIFTPAFGIVPFYFDR